MFSLCPRRGILLTMTIDEFGKVELRVGIVLSAEPMTGSEKLLKLQVDLGEKNEAGESVPRQIIAGIGKSYTFEVLLGKQVVIVANLEPRVLMGETSYGMLLAATNEEGLPVVLTTERDVAPGAAIK